MYSADIGKFAEAIAKCPRGLAECSAMLANLAEGSRRLTEVTAGLREGIGKSEDRLAEGPEGLAGDASVFSASDASI